MSLTAISEATRISEKMLVAIEAGQFAVLPQAYIRAFLRSYARALDLNPEETLSRYDSINRETQTQAPVSRPEAPEPKAPVDQPVPAAPRSLAPRATILAMIAIFAAIAAVVYLANRDSSSATQESQSKVPFDKAIHESEAAEIQPEPAAPHPVQPAVADSLRLEVTTTDSVWLMIAIDSIRHGQYLLPPKRVRTWAATDQFVISMGNAGVATFRLNGTELGALGKRGAVARNVVITRSGIQQPR